MRRILVTGPWQPVAVWLWVAAVIVGLSWHAGYSVSGQPVDVGPLIGGYMLSVVAGCGVLAGMYRWCGGRADVTVRQCVAVVMAGTVMVLVVSGTTRAADVAAAWIVHVAHVSWAVWRAWTAADWHWQTRRLR